MVDDGARGTPYPIEELPDLESTIEDVLCAGRDPWIPRRDGVGDHDVGRRLGWPCMRFPIAIPCKRGGPASACEQEMVNAAVVSSVRDAADVPPEERHVGAGLVRRENERDRVPIHVGHVARWREGGDLPPRLEFAVLVLAVMDP